MVESNFFKIFILRESLHWISGNITQRKALTCYIRHLIVYNFIYKQLNWINYYFSKHLLLSVTSHTEHSFINSVNHNTGGGEDWSTDEWIFLFNLYILPRYQPIRLRRMYMYEGTNYDIEFLTNQIIIRNIKMKCWDKVMVSGI